MKQTINNYFFSNFNSEIKGNLTTKNDLFIDTIYNLTTENNIIEPLNNFSNIFETLFEFSTYYEFKLNNSEFLENILDVQIYEFFSEDKNKIITRIFAISKSYELFEYDEESNKFISLNLIFNSKPKSIVIENKLYIYNFNDLFLMISEDKFPLVVSNFSNISSYVNYHEYTLFSTIENKYNILYSNLTSLIDIDTNSNPYNIISLSPENGEIKKIIIYKDNIYAVQQYNISKITINENGSKVNSFCSIHSEIYSETVSLIDDFIIFCSSSGIYIFDGNDIKQVFKNIYKNIKLVNKKAVTYNNKYYIQTNYRINNNFESVLLELNLETSNCNIYNLGNISDIGLIQTLNHYKLYAQIYINNNFEILTIDNNSKILLNKYLKFSKLSFDDKIIKVLNDIKLQSKGDFSISIKSDIQTAIFNSSEIHQIKNIGIKGQIFQIEIYGNDNFEIESINLKTSTIQED